MCFRLYVRVSHLEFSFGFTTILLVVHFFFYKVLLSLIRSLHKEFLSLISISFFIKMQNPWVRCMQWVDFSAPFPNRGYVSSASPFVLD
jgi:hypothetical protein